MDAASESMISVKSKYTLEKPIHKSDFKSTHRVVWRQSIILIQTFHSVYQEKMHTFISVEFEVLKNDGTRFNDSDEISLVNFGSVALFSEAKLTTSSGKHLKKVDNLHPICLMYKLLTSSQQTSQLMYGFEESTTIRRQELTNNKSEKGTFFVRRKLKDLFGFADQEKINYGFGYTLTLKRNSKNDVVFRTNAVDAAKVVVKDISWYIPHYVPSLENQLLVLNQVINKDPTELYYTERTVFRKVVITNNNRTFDLGTSGLSTPTFVVAGFHARNKIDSQTHDNATFDRFSVSNAVCNIGSEWWK